MAQPKKLSSNSEAHLAALQMFPKGFEFYDGPRFSLRGLRNDDYRWEVTFKESGEKRKCSSMVEAVQFIEKSCLEPK